MKNLTNHTYQCWLFTYHTCYFSLLKMQNLTNHTYQCWHFTFHASSSTYKLFVCLPSTSRPQIYLQPSVFKTAKEEFELCFLMLFQLEASMDCALVLQQQDKKLRATPPMLLQSSVFVIHLYLYLYSMDCALGQ